VYIKEWLPVWRVTTPEAGYAWFTANYGGRVKSEDWKIHTDPESGENVLSVRLWNVKGEWKDEEEAQEHARLLRGVGEHPEAEAVPRNSRREHVLRSYGKLLLKEATSEEAE
jgi:hypothetical protein